MANSDSDGIQAILSSGGRKFAECYRLVEQKTTMGELIAVYIGEPPN